MAARPVHELSNKEIVEEAKRFADRLRSAGVQEPGLSRRVAQEFPTLAQLQAVDADKRSNVLEKDEQRAVRKMAIAAGFRVYWLSQARESGQTPGLGDMWLAHPGRGVALWWETKRSVGGIRSTAQQIFADDCAATSTNYGFGDRYAFQRWLIEHGFPALPIPE